MCSTEVAVFNHRKKHNLGFYLLPADIFPRMAFIADTMIESNYGSLPFAKCCTQKLVNFIL